MKTIRERFEQFEDEYIKFDRIENKRSERPDLHAFLLLDELFPNPGRDMILAINHYEFFLDLGDNADVTTLTDDQICELVRCGVMIDSESEEYLCMFV